VTFCKCGSNDDRVILFKATVQYHELLTQ